MSGSVSLDIQDANSLKKDFEVCISEYNNEVLYKQFDRITTNDKGFFETSVENSSNNTFIVTIKKPGFLTRTISNFPINNNKENENETPSFDMWGGDIPINGVSDDSINMKDVLEIEKAFSTSSEDTKYNADCDLNKDTFINMVDVLIMAKNFGKNSSDYK